MSDLSKKLTDATARIDVSWSARDVRRLYGQMSAKGARRQRARRTTAAVAVLLMAGGAAAAWRVARRPSLPGDRPVMNHHLSRGATPLRPLTPTRLKATSGAATGDVKKLLAFPPKVSGLDGLKDVCAQVDAVEASPFDGLILPSLVSGLWRGKPTAASLQPIADPLRCLGRGRVTENFLHIETGHPDWFDDARFEATIVSARTLAKFLRDLPVRGLVLDTQAYVLEQGPFRANLNGRSLAEVEARVRRRGREVMDALQTGGRTLDVLVTVGYAEAFRRTCVEGQPLAESDLALLPAFLDGLVEGRDALPASARPYLSDIFLASYPTRQPDPFLMFRDLIHGDWDAAVTRWVPGVTTYNFPIKADPWSGARVWPPEPRLLCNDADRAKVSRGLAAGFGMMLDYEHDIRGGFALTPAEFSRNNATPEQFQETLAAAILVSDRYVWIFSSTLAFWPGDSTRLSRVPNEYLEAIRAARP